MRRLKRFIDLKNCDRWVLLRTFFVVAVAAAALRVLPLEMARRAVARAAVRTKKLQIQQLVWAVQASSRYVPRATCLTQALALQAMLGAAGFEARLEIGVAKDAGKALEAHAWVVCGHQIVIGGPDVGRYRPLLTWEFFG